MTDDSDTIGSVNLCAVEPPSMNNGEYGVRVDNCHPMVYSFVVFRQGLQSTSVFDDCDLLLKYQLFVKA